MSPKRWESAKLSPPCEILSASWRSCLDTDCSFRGSPTRGHRRGGSNDSTLRKSKADRRDARDHGRRLEDAFAFLAHSGTEASVSSQPRVSYRSPCRVTATNGSYRPSIRRSRVGPDLGADAGERYRDEWIRILGQPESVSGRRVLALIAIARGHRRLPAAEHPTAGSTSEAYGLQMSRIPPRAPFPNGIARGRRCRLRSKFATDSLLEGAGFEPSVPRQKDNVFRDTPVQLAMAATAERSHAATVS